MQPRHFRHDPRPVTVAATQFSCGWNADENIATAEAHVREAAARGAQIILLPELFETPYFCIEQDARHLKLAAPLAENIAGALRSSSVPSCSGRSTTRPEMPESLSFSTPTAMTQSYAPDATP